LLPSGTTLKFCTGPCFTFQSLPLPLSKLSQKAQVP
jgi:hypothetical protein